MAITAFALFSAFEAGVETLAIFFLAKRLFAGASSYGDKRRNSIEIVWMLIICYLLCMVNLLLIIWNVFTANTHTARTTSVSLGKALAV
jgi:NADH:ubiquinone oxidoreductase subunit 5 (subunit L)/multisubunit Na+/H+ antiporter MnhA subunit